MSRFAPLKPVTRSKLKSACRSAAVQRPVLESVERRVLFTTYAVNTVADITNAGDAFLSLREAIVAANGNFGADTIRFNLTGGGTQTFAPTSALPAITDTITIDGAIPPDVNPPTPQIIEISGANIPASSGASGLVVNTNGSLIQNLVINRFATSTGTGGNGIIVTGNTNAILFNKIGVGTDGTTARGNQGRGILVSGGNDNTIDSNIIAYNANDGIAVTDDDAAPSTGTEFSANSIYSNGGLGIDLGPDGVTANDANDVDAGANSRQNFPLITSVVISNGKATVTGTINTTPSSTVVLDFYASSVAAREGRISLTERDSITNDPITTPVTTNASGNASFTFTVSPRDGSSLVAGTSTFITATATSYTGVGGFPINTSEFSAPVASVTVAGNPTLPRVQKVFVRGSGVNWTDPFLSFIQNSGAGSNVYGYAIPASAGNVNLQSLALPWANINQISIQFTEAMSQANLTTFRNSLVVHGLAVPNYTIANFTYDPDTFTGVWTLNTTMMNDRVLLNLDGDVGTGVIDADSANRLDGEWANGTPTGTTTSTFPSGNATVGGDFRFQFNVLGGDTNGDGTVTVGDLGILSTNFGTTQIGIRAGDATGDGLVTVGDLGILATNFNLTLPAGTPAPVIAGDTKTATAAPSASIVSTSMVDSAKTTTSSSTVISPTTTVKKVVIPPTAAPVSRLALQTKMAYGTRRH